MTSQQYANAMLEAWHERRKFLERIRQSYAFSEDAIQAADEMFCDQAVKLTRDYERSLISSANEKKRPK